MELRRQNGARFMVVGEGGVPIYSYPKVENEKENLLSFLFGALTSLSDEIWEGKAPIKLERGEKHLFSVKKGEVFFSVITNFDTEGKKVVKLLKDLTDEFIKRFGRDLDQLTLIKPEKKQKFSKWLQRQVKARGLGHHFLEDDTASSADQHIGKELGHVVQKTETKEFTFEAVKQGIISRNQYVVVTDREDERKVLAQVREIEKQTQKELATCKALRVLHEKSLYPIRRPVSVNSPVFLPKSELLEEIFSPTSPKKLLIGNLLTHPEQVPIFYSLEDLRTHLFIVASTGGGKSYTLGVLIEELLALQKENDTAILIFDFHNEFGGLVLPNQSEEQIAELEARDLSPREFCEDLLIFNWKWNPIKFSPKFTPDRLKFLSDMPEEYSLFLQNLMEEGEERLDLETLEQRVKASDLHHARKRAIKSRINGLRNSGLFSENFFEPKDIIEPGKASLIQLGNIRMGDWAVRFIVANLLRDIYQAKLKGELPSDIVLFLDEAHKFAPRSSDDPLGKIIHTITREGRKLGLWLVISTQTSRDLSEAVMKNCNSMLALRSPERQTKILSRIYGISKKNTEILSELPPGKGYLKAPSLPFPLMVDIRPRKTTEIPKQGEIRAKIQEKVKDIALRTKKRLLYTRPKEKIKTFISEHKKFTPSEIAKSLSLSIEKVKNLLSELEGRIVPSPKGQYFYSRQYWKNLKDKARSMLDQRRKLEVKKVSQHLDLSSAEVEKLLHSLGLQQLTPNTWYSVERIKELKKSAKEAVREQGKLQLTDLSTRLGLSRKETERLLAEPLEGICTLASTRIYSPSFLRETREKIRTMFEDTFSISQEDLLERLDLPTTDLKQLLDDLPLTHLHDQKYWYWEPKLEELRESVASFVEDTPQFTAEEIGEQFGLPTIDVKHLLEELEIEDTSIEKKVPSTPLEQARAISEKILKRVEEMPLAARHIIKILLNNDGRAPASKVSVNERILSYLKEIDLLSSKWTERGNEILLRLDQYLKEHFEVTPTQQLVNKVAYELYKELSSN